MDINEIKYLTFEGGGGKGIVYLGVVRALEQVYKPIFFKIAIVFFIGVTPVYVYAIKSNSLVTEKHNYSVEFYYSIDTVKSFEMKDFLVMYNENVSEFDSLTRGNLSLITFNPSAKLQLIDSIRISRNTTAFHFTTLIRRGNNTPLRITSCLSTKVDSSIFDYYLFPNSYIESLTGQGINSFKLCFFYNTNTILVTKEISQFKIFYYLSNHDIDSIFSTLNGVKVGVEYKKESKHLTIYCNNKSYHVLPKEIFYTSKFHKKYCAIHPYYWFVGTLQNLHLIAIINNTSSLTKFTSNNNDMNSFPIVLEEELNTIDNIINLNLQK